MTNRIYGVDPQGEITPLMIRDAITTCFFTAHCEDTGVEGEQDTNREYCKMIVKDAFEKTGGNFDDPTKEDIFKVLDHLSEFSKNFRNPDIIKKHSQEIMKLVEKLK